MGYRRFVYIYIYKYHEFNFYNFYNFYFILYLPILILYFVFFYFILNFIFFKNYFRTTINTSLLYSLPVQTGGVSTALCTDLQVLISFHNIRSCCELYLLTVLSFLNVLPTHCLPLLVIFIPSLLPLFFLLLLTNAPRSIACKQIIAFLDRQN